MSEQLERLKTALADRYTIQHELGSGGMATVYLAEDLKHHRQVALKVLRPELAAILGGERFLKEIEVTANLQHPNILPLYDSGEANTFLYYVMPYIEGESLRDKLNREKQLSVEETVEIAKSVAAALQFAHERNVVHRDIKPENILLQAGQALVADFGIALAVSQAGGTRLTETGLSLGTPHYMSPEQATGDRELDARSDVYSLGCVCYEMLVGEPPHLGHSVQAIVAKILSDTPTPITRSRELVPTNVDAAVQRALAKTPADRFASAGEFAAALTNRSFTLPTTVTVDVASASVTPWNSLSRALATAAAVLLLTTLWGILRNQPAAGPAVYDVALPDSAPMLTEFLPGFAVSSLGEFVVYTAVRDTTTELWYRSLADGTTQPIPGTEGAQWPAVSPDDERVAFFTTDGQMRIVAVEGGVARTVAESFSYNSRAHWMSESRILVVDGDGLVLRQLDPAGGEIEVPHLVYCILPQPLPSRDGLLCGGGGDKGAHVETPGDTALQYLRSGETSGLDSLGAMLRGSDFRLIDERYLTYMSIDGDLRATSVDLRTLRVGRSVTMVPGVRLEAYTGAGQYNVAASGSLVFATGENANVGRLVKFSGANTVVPLPVDPAAFLRYDITGDGRRLAAVVDGLRGQELRVYDLSTIGGGQLWLPASFVGEPLWNASGDTLTAMLIDDPAEPPAVVRGSPTAATPPDTLLSGEQIEPFQYISHDVLLMVNWSPPSALSLDISATPPAVDTILKNVLFPSISPDGRWIAFQSTDLSKLYLEPRPSNNQRFQIPLGGDDPQWLSPSEFVFFHTSVGRGATFFRVRVDASQDPPVGEAIPWWTDPRWVDTSGQSYTITPDGGIVYVQGPEQKPATFLRVIPNWVDQMKRAVDEANR